MFRRTTQMSTIAVLLTTMIGCQNASPKPATSQTAADGPATAPSAAASAATLSADDLARRTIERRAVEAVIWGMLAVNFDLMYQATVQSKGAFNQVLYWSRLFDSKNQTLTPNSGTVYFHPFYNTKDVGPMVLEIPSASDEGSITGSVDDAWQTAIEDVGPAGVDKGKGGKYLILSVCVSTRERNQFPSVPDRPLQHLSVFRINDLQVTRNRDFLRL